MKRTFALILLLCLAAGAQDDRLAKPKFAILAGKVMTMDLEDRILDNAVIFIADGKIERIVPQRGTKIPEGYRVID
ncbi:MAG: hypothetical protein KDB53_09070, partial [Planctomycetes bacterium]|nr:hypothetical protein [Planctomycetota bacterium]